MLRRIQFVKHAVPAQGRSQDGFFKGGVTLCRKLKKWLFSYGQDIVMAFSLSVVGCLVNNGLQKGGSRAPQDPPCLRPCQRDTLVVA